MAARDGRIARIEALLAANGAPDPNDAEDRLAMDEHFDFYRESLAGLPEDERILAPAAYAGRVGMIPAPLAREIEGGLLSKDPAAQVNAAKRFAFVEKQLPKPCFEGVFTHVPCARARELTRYDRMGVEPERAVELTDRLFRPGEDQGEVRTRPYKPGEDGGEVRTLPYKPGEDDARAVLLSARAPAGRGAADGRSEGEEGEAPETIVGAGGNETLSEEPGSDRLDEPVTGSGRPRERPGEQARSDAGHSLGDLTRDKLFDVIRERLRDREGGFVDDPGDHGGPTNKGMSQEFYDQIADTPRYADFLEETKDLTDEQITQIYRNEFFNQPKLDRLMEVEGLLEESPQLFEQTFDAVVHHGADTGAQLLQVALDDVVGSDLTENGSASDSKASASADPKSTGTRLESYDGNIGPETRGAVEQAVSEGLAAAVNDRMVELRIEYMKEQPNFARYQDDWLERAGSFRSRDYIAPKFD